MHGTELNWMVFFSIFRSVAEVFFKTLLLWQKQILPPPFGLFNTFTNPRINDHNKRGSKLHTAIVVCNENWVITIASSLPFEWMRPTLYERWISTLLYSYASGQLLLTISPIFQSNAVIHSKFHGWFIKSLFVTFDGSKLTKEIDLKFISLRGDKINCKISDFEWIYSSIWKSLTYFIAWKNVENFAKNIS